MSKRWLWLIMMAAVVVFVEGCPDIAPTPSQQRPKATQPDVEKELFTKENWAVLATDPDSHKNAWVDIVGKVFADVDKDANATYLQMFCDPQNSEWNTIVIYDDPAFQVRTGDFVRVTGIVVKEVEGENALGAKITAPLIAAVNAEVVDALAAAPEAIRIMNQQLTKTQHSVSITLDKVEFASNETRVFITVVNNTSKKAHIYAWQARILQGDSQFDKKHTRLDYPEVQSELLPGVKSAGVITFPALDPEKEMKLYIEARSEDYRLDFDPYTFVVPGSEAE